ncbi:hypothetical protein [Kosakonia phage Kc166A]|uniref:Poly A polymerase head domain-containing protein n=1 Tax=Kosakonia phage Kc166A TaxID=2801381 RepID=A0AAE7RK76_9CAUD|nr:hypothetical protein [Kosakonia phage Kc166A]
MTTTTRLQKAVAVLKGLESDINAAKGLNSQPPVYGILAGGCARDVHFGLEPKDWDIMFGRDVTLSQIEFSLSENGICGWKVFHFYNKGLNDRIKLCVKFNFEGEAFDVLVYDVDEAFSAVDMFDFNLNQFFISRREDHPAVYAGTTNLSQLVAIRGDHSPERGAKMQGKHTQLRMEGKL